MVKAALLEIFHYECYLNVFAHNIKATWKIKCHLQTLYSCDSESKCFIIELYYLMQNILISNIEIIFQNLKMNEKLP